jgi:thiamine-phosphate pyrophosphorylase
VAIGGVDAARAAEVRATGAAGMAVVSAICGQPSVATATRRLAGAWHASTGVGQASTGVGHALTGVGDMVAGAGQPAEGAVQ